MMVLSKTHLSAAGFKLIQKANGDVVIAMTDASNEVHERVFNTLETAYPALDYDTLMNIAGKAVKEANVQLVAKTIADTPAGLQRAAYDSEDVYRYEDDARAFSKK